MAINNILGGFDAMAAAQRTGGEASARPVTPFGDVGVTLEESQQLAFRVMDLVSRLIGTVPTEGKVDAQPVPEGLLFTVQQHALATKRTLDTAVSELNRLERMLP